ncbi:hypothetical protein [Streptomyces tubercidicus]|uniref:Uncharacterized protein n=1 Tax=Streptomyces tubercidicus TaxID=47759 RepID=A0A640V2L4_9ACTN|nr:hypothetical protein [Streptomyces tubercidicus]WAU15339.1 hypothetical protein STRTU_006044 [Streptomyces tubercidicus]GFE41181.1 hypothetical protein Stube_58540 [Streptomyces tubercidicus]
MDLLPGLSAWQGPERHTGGNFQVAEEYQVDLSALQQVITRLNSLVDTMDGVGTTAEYKTELPEGYLGQGFAEEAELRNAHSKMKREIAAMVAELKHMIADAGKKSRTVHDDYDSREQEVRQSMR